MKKLIFILVLLFPSVCFGSTVIIYQNDTQEVYSISPRDDAVMPNTGYTKVIIKDNFWDLDLQYPHQCYKWNGSRLIPNSKRLDEEAIKEEKVREKVEIEKKIQSKIREMAIQEIKKVEPEFNGD